MTFNYDTNLQTTPDSNFSGEAITVTVNDSTGSQVQPPVVYMKSRASLEVNGQTDGYIPALWYIQNQVNDKISFGYISDAYTDFDFIRKQKTGNYSGRNFSTLLRRVEYPRSVSWYDYNKHQINLGTSGFTDEYQVISRKDTLFKFDSLTNTYKTSKNDAGYNQMNFSYAGNYTGYTGSAGMPSAYTYSSTSSVQSNSAIGGLATTNEFNQDGQLLSSTTVAPNGEMKITKNEVFSQIYKTKPTKTSLSEYTSSTDSSPNQLYVEYQYSDWGGLLSSTKPLTASQFNNSSIKSKYTTSFTYDPTYYFIKTKTWYQNQNDAVPLTEQYDYFADSRLKSITNANNEVTNYCYSG